MKQRFSSLDLQIISHELSARLVSLRLSNVYDLSSRIFLLKFARPDHREQLLLDSGFRCHLTSFSRATASAPSPFVARLRKFLRTRRVTAVQQVGTDRVLEIQFSDGQYRLFLEFYAGGNVVLTDAECNVLALLRSVGEGEEHERYRVGGKYELERRQNYGGVPPLTRERLKEGLQKAAERQELESKKPGKKIKRKPGDQLRKALAVTTTEFPPILIEHGLHVAGVERTLLPEDVVGSEQLLDQVLQALAEATKVVQQIKSSDVATGYILAKKNPKAQPAANGNGQDEFENLLYDDFHPFKPAQLAEDPAITFVEIEGFNRTVDEFFSSIEGQKLESRLQEREDNAKRKIQQARNEQAKRMDGLQSVQDLNERKAQAIEANVERVEEAVAAVNGLIAQGMDWRHIDRLIEGEQGRNNAVAQMIKLPLKLKENSVTLLLAELGVDDDDGLDETDSEPSDSEDDSAAPAAQANRAEDKRLAIDVDLALSAWSNARRYYDHKRTAADKQERTAQASQKALKSAEQKVLADLKKGLKQEKEILRPVRKQFWFEKFIYFISTDRHLVLAGRDAQQSEILYRRYLKKGDVYVNADVAGAASVIVKNNPATPTAPIPPSTLSQAGQLAVCTSRAWDSKAGMSAWWVDADQVSKTGSTGEYLAPGEFVVRGKKNFLPPAQLLLGFAAAFQISEESTAKHVKHRLTQAEDGLTSRATTPELTDGETIAESEIAGDGTGGDSSDDDFLDATAAPRRMPVPARDQNNVDDDDDDFPDATPRAEGVSRDDFADSRPAGLNGAQNRDDDDEGEDVEAYANPLQSSAPASSSKALEDEDDEEEDDHEDHEDEEADEEQDEASSTATPGTQVPPSQADEDAGPPQLSNKERKATQRVEKGKPINVPKPKQSKPVRGKKGKAKKIAAKYADQDDEDRELAMQILGSRAAAEKREAEAQAKVAKAESSEDARLRRRAQHERAQREGLEAEEARRMNLETFDEGDEDEQASLDTLVGTPLPGDEILEALPICAPWSALGRYKYKVKLQPGQQKKGKAVREILGRWTKDASDAKKVDANAEDTERIWPREAELLKGWKEVEVVGVVPVKQVRVVMSGGQGDKGKGKKASGGGRGGRGSKRR